MSKDAPLTRDFPKLAAGAAKSFKDVAPIPEALKRTPLYPLQAAFHPKFGSFGGWELPIYYRSILDEHETVRTRVGLFDVSHLGHLEVSGPGDSAIDGLQPLFTRDLNRLKVGAAFYSPMLNDQGWILDEMILYHLHPGRIRLVVNAANGDKVIQWLRAHLDSRVKVEDLRQRVGTLALQGPEAVELMERVSSDPLTQLARYHLQSGKVAGHPAIAARTGYTGEDGFELFLAVEDLGPVWQELLKVGRPFGIQPIGLGARDTLRLEAGLPLGGSDLDERTTPLEAGLEWTVDWPKGPFIGREALERQKASGVSRRLVGFELLGAGIPRHGYPILREGRRIGEVTSGSVVPGTARGLKAIGMGYVTPDSEAPATPLIVEIHGRPVPAQVVKLPFYRRAG